MSRTKLSIVRTRRRLRPETSLKAVIVAGLFGLVVLPYGSDMALAAARPVAAAAETCRVVSVVDGDTVRLWCPDGRGGAARLTGFDTPELSDPACAAEYAAALAAKWHLRRLIWQAADVSMRRDGTDRYGRALVALSLDGRPVELAMIEAGHARPYGGGPRRGWCVT